MLADTCTKSAHTHVHAQVHMYMHTCQCPQIYVPVHVHVHTVLHYSPSHHMYMYMYSYLKVHNMILPFFFGQSFSSCLTSEGHRDTQAAQEEAHLLTPWVLKKEGKKVKKGRKRNIVKNRREKGYMHMHMYMHMYMIKLFLISSFKTYMFMYVCLYTKHAVTTCTNVHVLCTCACMSDSHLWWQVVL